MAAQAFAYKACDTQGKIHEGRLNGDSEQEILSLLQARQLIPIEIKPARGGQNNAGLFQRGVAQSDVIDFTNGLCTLVEARVPLDKALNLLEGITEKPAMQQLISNLRREVKEGKSLAEALKAYPQVFSRMYINMVHAGEEGGILDKLLPRLSRFLEDANEAKRTVISALIYPIILAVVGVLSVIMLLVFVVPQFATLFEDMGSAIPDSAAFLMALSNWLQSYGWSLGLLPVLAWALWRHMGGSPERRLQRDRFLLGLPLLGHLILEAESSRFCRTLGALLGAGIPLLKALSIVRGVMENQQLAHSLAQIEEVVRGGTSLGKAMNNSNQFPVLLSQLVIVGEESGRTAAILDKLAETFDTHVRQQTSRLVAMLEPLLIVTLGLVVGAVVIIMLSAIFSINEVQF